MRQALPHLAVLMLCGCAGTIAPRRLVTQNPAAPAGNAPAVPAAVPAPSSAPLVSPVTAAVVPPDKFQTSGNIPSGMILEKPPGALLSDCGIAVSGSLSLSVGYGYSSSRADHSGRLFSGLHR